MTIEKISDKIKSTAKEIGVDEKILLSAFLEYLDKHWTDKAVTV
jgi:hypothetical protein